MDDIGEQAGPVGIGIDEGDTEDQHGDRPQREGIVSGDIRPRQAGVERADHAGHALLVFLPKGEAKGALGGRLVLLHADGLMRQRVAGLQHAVGFGNIRPADAGERDQKQDEGDGKGKEGKAVQPGGNAAEKAEPGRR